jgi:hypothetical protein
MEEDDEEFYGPDTASAPGGDHTEAKQSASNGLPAEKDDDDAELESGEEEEEDDESDSVSFTRPIRT